MNRSHSSISLFMECQKQYEFKYVHRLEPIDTTDYSAEGRAFHEAVQYRDPGKIVAYTQLSAEQRAVLIALAKEYLKNYPDDGHTAQTEQRFSVPLEGEHALVGAIDSIGTDEFGAQFFRETKTVRKDISPGSEYWQRVDEINPQMDTYFIAARLAGLNPTYCEWDAVRVPALRRRMATPVDKREFYKRATGTARVGDPKPGTYLHDETFDEFLERVQSTISQEPHLYMRREKLFPNEARIAKTLQELKGAHALMERAESAGEFVPNKKACYVHRTPCAFVPVCACKTTKEDVTLYKIRPTRQEGSRK